MHRPYILHLLDSSSGLTAFFLSCLVKGHFGVPARAWGACLPRACRVPGERYRQDRHDHSYVVVVGRVRVFLRSEAFFPPVDIQHTHSSI